MSDRKFVASFPLAESGAVPRNEIAARMNGCDITDDGGASVGKVTDTKLKVVNGELVVEITGKVSMDALLNGRSVSVELNEGEAPSKVVLTQPLKTAGPAPSEGYSFCNIF